MPDRPQVALGGSYKKKEDDKEKKNAKVFRHGGEAQVERARDLPSSNTVVQVLNAPVGMVLSFPPSSG